MSQKWSVVIASRERNLLSIIIFFIYVYMRIWANTYMYYIEDIVMKERMEENRWQYTLCSLL